MTRPAPSAAPAPPAAPAPAPHGRVPTSSVALLLLALLVALAALRNRPPAPRPAEAPAAEFSAERARTVLERIVGDPAPHGVATAHAAVIRDRIEAELVAAGLSVQRQSTWSCRGLACAPVINLVAERPGTGAPGDPVVLLVAHYDSVHAGPGVADDLHGVAVLIEVARALGADGPLPHAVRLLVDEGEEVGLLGAAAYVDEPSRIADVAVVINVEARGTRGLSALFETSDGNGALVRAYLDHAPRPNATSLAYEVYRRMPNDTDLSVFKRAGLAGLNFAFVGGVGRYHTPLDDLEHLDPGSVQHQGDNVLATTRALARGPLPVPVTDDAIYGDVLGWTTVSWPRAHAGWVAGGLLAALLALVGIGARRRRLGPARVLLGVVAIVALLTGTIAIAWGLASLVAAVQGEALAAHARPLPMQCVLWLTAIGVARAIARVLGRWATPLELGLGVWITWAALGLTLALTIPGISAAWCIPLGLAVVGLAWATLSSGPATRGLLLACVIGVTQWTMLAWALEDVFGFALVPALAMPVAFAISPLLPCLGPPRARDSGREGPSSRAHRYHRWESIGLLTALGLATIAACVVPVYDASQPRRIALMHYDDRGAHEATLAAAAVDRLPASLRDTAGLSPEARAALPWTARPVHVAAARPGPGPAPTLEPTRIEATDDGGRWIQARLRSPRGADRAIVLLPSDAIAHATVEGHAVATPADALGRMLIFGVPSDGVAIEITTLGSDPIEATVVDCVSGLPPSAAAIAQARDAATAVPIQWGDLGCIGAPVTL